MSLFKKLFTLPPPSTNRMLFNFRINKASGYDFDDVYIFYLLFRASFMASLALGLVYVFSYEKRMSFDFQFFVINMPAVDFVKIFLQTYSKCATLLLVLIVLPYYLLFFRVNIEPVTWLPSWIGSTAMKAATKRENWEILLFSSSAIMALMYFSNECFLLIMESFHLENSLPFLLACLVTIPLFLSLCNVLLFFAWTTCWRSLSQNKRI